MPSLNPQNPSAQAVKRSRKRETLACNPSNSLHHFLRRFIGEGDEQDLRRLDIVLAQEIRHARCEDFCLPRSRTSDDHRWSIEWMQDCFLLLRIEGIEK